MTMSFPEFVSSLRDNINDDPLFKYFIRTKNTDQYSIKLLNIFNNVRYDINFVDEYKKDHKKIRITKYSHVWSIGPTKEEREYLVYDHYNLQFIRDIVYQEKIDDSYIYCAQKIRSSTYGSSLCDITIHTIYQN